MKFERNDDSLSVSADNGYVMVNKQQYDNYNNGEKYEFVDYCKGILTMTQTEDDIKDIYIEITDEEIEVINDTIIRNIDELIKLTEENELDNIE